MYIDNIGEEFVIGAYPCSFGSTGPTGPDGTKFYTRYYEIESVDTPLKGPAGLNVFIVEDADALKISDIPPFLFDGKEYTEMTIVITGLVYFQDWDVIIQRYNAGNPPIPCLMINANFYNSLQRIYYGLEEGDTQYRIRYEGTNSPSGIVGEPNIVWELTYYYDYPGRFDIVYGEITQPTTGDEKSVNAISSGQGYLGQMDGVGNTAFRIYPNEKLVSTINVKGDGFRTGIKNDVLYVDVDPFYPLVINDNGGTVTMTSPNLFNIESTGQLTIQNTGECVVKTRDFDVNLDSKYYGNISTNPGFISENVQNITALNNVQLVNIPQYNSASIPTGPEYLVWVDENNFLRVL